MTNRCLLGAGVALAVAFGGVQAHAQSVWWPTGTPWAWYIGPEGGWTSLTSNNSGTVSGVSFTGPGNTPGTTQTFTTPGTANPQRNFDSGFNVGARGGVQWGPWRLEEEYSYRNNQGSSFNTLNGFTTSGTHGSGSTHSNALMTNAIFDFGLWGWNWGSINSFTLHNPIGAPIVPNTPLSVAPQTFGGTLINGSGWRFGYQAIAGLRFEFSPVVALDIDYRYLGTTDQTLTNNARFPFPNGTRGTNCCVGTRFQSSYHSNNILASLTMKFGAPPAPPPPLPPAPPPPPPQKVFLVFFDWDKYNITPEGERIIELAAQQYKAGGSVKLQVTGYTDTSGSAGYNQRLSERRANAVATRLAALGVARSDMSVIGRGENDLRVPTPNGVREPQNRRVEILFP